MFRFLSYSLLFLYMASGCKEVTSTDRVIVTEQNGTDPIYIDRLYGETENYLSFPIWFDTALISKEGITRIDRSIFLIDLDDTLENGQPVQSLRERRQYWFFPSGRVKKIKVTHYYDDQDVGHMTFGYYDTIDQHGFSAAYKMDATGFLPDADLPADFPFRLDRYVNETKKVRSYRDEVTKTDLFVFNSPANWGVISIDSIANPKASDWIILGTVIEPDRMFHLKNKVVIENEINWKRNQPKNTDRVTIDNYPFYIHRNYAYAKGGNFNHFIDSTFSDEGFLSHTYHLLSRNKRGWIDKMVRKKENQGHQSTAIRVEFFNYETKHPSTADPNKMRNFTKNQKR